MAEKIRWRVLAAAVAAPTALPAAATDGLSLDQAPGDAMLHIAALKSAPLIAAGGAMTIQVFGYIAEAASAGWYILNEFPMTQAASEAEPLPDSAAKYDRIFARLTAIAAGAVTLSLGQSE